MDKREALPGEPIQTTHLLSRVLEISTVGVIFFDPGGDIMEANEAFLSMSGFTQDDVRAGLLRWDRLTPPEWMAASLQAIHQLKTFGSTVPYEKEYFRKDGTRFRGLFAAKGLAEHLGVEFILDVTETHRTADLLKQSEERFRQLSDSNPVGVYQADLDGSITYANPMAQQIFSMSQADLLGRGWLTRLHPDDATRVAREWSQAIAANTPYCTEYRLHVQDEETRTISARSVMLHSEDGQPFGVVGTVEDITAQKRAEQALRESEKLAAVGRLAASIAHEINNPLESVMNLLYLARSTSDPEEIRAYLDTAEQELRRVAIISNQTLRFHRQAKNPTELFASKLVEEIASIYQGKLMTSRVVIETKCTHEVTVKCFEGEIRQIVNNLVGNAIDAMHPTGGRLLLRCRAARNWGEGCTGVAITVADTGSGMPKSVAAKIFNAFYTTKGAGGSGLGLWVTRGIVDRHHGTLKVRSRQADAKSGTVFRLFLPLDAVSRED
jgi:PAS domain S-box-containing protein